jgi:hypothetical protein
VRTSLAEFYIHKSTHATSHFKFSSGLVTTKQGRPQFSRRTTNHAQSSVLSRRTTNLVQFRFEDQPKSLKDSKKNIRSVHDAGEGKGCRWVCLFVSTGACGIFPLVSSRCFDVSCSIVFIILLDLAYFLFVLQSGMVHNFP